MSADTFVVARAVVRKHVTLQDVTEGRAEVQVGKPFVVALSYTLYEASPEEEEWRFKIASSLDGQPPIAAEAVQTDHRILKDDMWSYLANEHVCQEPGEHQVVCTIDVQVASRPWGSHETMAIVDHQRLECKLRVVAR